MPTKCTEPRSVLSGAALRSPAHHETTTLADGPLAGFSMPTRSALFRRAVTCSESPSSVTLTLRRSIAGLLVPSPNRRASPVASVTVLPRWLSSGRGLTFLPASSDGPDVWRAKLLTALPARAPYWFAVSAHSTRAAPSVGSMSTWKKSPRLRSSAEPAVQPSPDRQIGLVWLGCSLTLTCCTCGFLDRKSTLCVR